MLTRLAALCLSLCAAPLLAGTTLLDPASLSCIAPGDPTKPAGERHDADWYATFRERIDGLDTPLFMPGDIPPPACDPTRKGATLGLFIGAGKSIQDKRFWLPGPANDVSLFRNSLTLRGADPDNLVILTDDSATHTDVARAAESLLERAACNDSVVIHFSGWGLSASGLGLPDDASGPFELVRKTKYLSELGGHAQWRTPADTALAAAPFALLNSPDPRRGGVLSAAALSELVTRFRNRGAHVSVSIDGPSATRFAVEERQARVDPRLYARATLTGPKPRGDTELNRPACWTPTTLVPTAGELTVFYGTESNNPGFERTLPPRPEEIEGGTEAAAEPAAERKVFGFLSYQLATAVSISERTTIGALARYIEADSATRLRSQDFTFITTDPDLDLVAEDRADRAFQAPQILIDSPELTRSALKLQKPDIEIRGRVNARGLPVQVKVNDALAQPDGDTGFLARLRLKAGVNKVTVHAFTDADESLRYDFELYYEGDIRAVIGEGRRYAMIVANQDYADGSGIPDLKTPISDAQALRDLLTSRYGFETTATDPTGNTIDLFLENSDFRTFLITLGTLEKLAGPRDSVLIFYAGHGEYDVATNAAYWLPVDAMQNFSQTYFDAKTLNDTLQRMQAGNVLVISDSCYSGMLLRSTDDGAPAIPPDARLEQLQRMAESRSRVVMSSGGNAPVLDGGGDGHSVFARALLRALENPEQTAFSARELHARIQAEVTARTGQSQEPDFRTIYGAGHDAGDFVFLAEH